ncbi:hypothetical protein GUITHDRAFT_105725 [Guillardia theta CCMP2712]|uniref:Oxidation resistance protein 1 n=1 Tax=Guillardia theta (strain CCMP2712) TaxID=905079 RepID=L1JKG0_GUITC|nr:hypothetical protein GUITHDRAFT_105725 [Guillardia theta CCMP2712]EKX48580.1 hypothetical protein GUITHDRAFT_105725 [Guillardia theta CCMP2712]|eukprot:XP_005835560.1 hypothetical protein GUITHDRAFT_105725 [Guillardia theta CCMP2712]
MPWAFFRRKPVCIDVRDEQRKEQTELAGAIPVRSSEHTDEAVAQEEKEPGLFSLLPMDLADKVLVLLDGHALARVCCCNTLFAQHIHCQHPAWRVLQQERYAESANDRQRYLEVARDRCSLCGLPDDVQKELQASKKYFCSTCTFRHADRIREMEKFDKHLHRKAIELDTSIRRRNLNPLLKSDTLKDLFAAKPLAPPKLLFSTKFHGHSLSRFFSSTSGMSNTLLMIETYDGEQLGSFTREAWKNMGERPFGSDKSFLFRCRPSFQCFSGQPGHSGYQFACKDGIACGGSNCSRLSGIFVDCSLTRGSSLPSMQFRNPNLASTPMFEIKHLEVWKVFSVEEERLYADLSDDDDPFDLLGAGKHDS